MRGRTNAGQSHVQIPGLVPPSEITVADICSRAAGPDHNPNLTRNRDP